MKKMFLSIIILFLNNESIVHAQLSVVSNGDTTEIWDQGFTWSCGANFFPITRTSQDTIYITERDTMPRATCDCSYSVCTKMTNLNPGTYTAMVARQWHNHELFPGDTTIEYFIGSVTFDILKTPTKQSEVAFYQSPCSGELVGDDISMPKKYLLLTNYPNPFNPSTIIRYKIPNKSHVVLSVYNLAGQKIATLVDEQKRSGSYDINFNAAHLSTGMYVCHLIVGGNAVSSKMFLIK